MVVELTNMGGILLDVPIARIQDWIQATATANRDAEAGGTAEKDVPGAVTSAEAAVEARDAMQRAALELRTNGLEEVAQKIDDLVVVKVEATGDQKVERKAVTVLVGAEEHRARLESLLRRRRIITGN